MKKYLALFLILSCVFGLLGCNRLTIDQIIKTKPNVTGIVKEVHDNYVIMYSETAKGYPNGSTWQISLNVVNKDSYIDLVVDDEIVVYHDGNVMESDPLRVGKVYAITLKTPANRKEVLNNLGIYLEAKNVTPEGLTIVCKHSGGENIEELKTGSFYVIQKYEETNWIDVPYLPQEYDIAWTSEAWIINKENTTEWDVNWKWLYGELPVGEYRIGKEIMNFRSTGNYDKEMIYTNFTIR